MSKQKEHSSLHSSEDVNSSTGRLSGPLITYKRSGFVTGTTLDDKYLAKAIADILEHIAEIIGEDEIDETGINATTQYGLGIDSRNRLRAEQRRRAGL